jgi:hypothetical protein
MDRIRNNKALCFLVALFLIIGLMPMTGTAYAVSSYQSDDTLRNQELTRISITADLHLLQDNRARFEAYLIGIQGFNPDMVIFCGDQFEGNYTPPEEGDYSSAAAIDWDFADPSSGTLPTNPYDEIKTIADHYLPGVPLIFVRGNNDYFNGNDYDQFAGFGPYPIQHYGLVKTKYVDVFRFGAPNGDDPDFKYSSDQITALNDYLANRSDKSKLVLVSGHYPIDDDKLTPTNNKTYFRNAGNSNQVKDVLEEYDQPVVFLWSHNHDTGPVLEEHIFRTYGTGYYTMNSGAVGYKDTMDYTQGINMVLGSNGRMIDFTMARYDLMGNAEPLYSGAMGFPEVEQFWGDGTKDKPYLIDSAENLRYLALMVNNGEKYSGKHFRQTDDIDLSGDNWKPIGKYVSSSPPNDTRNRQFSGIYDGNGCIISGLTIEQNLVGSPIINKGYGLFGFLTGEVRNLGMTDININAEISGSYNMYAGGIAGYVGYYDTYAGFIENCFVSGNIQAEARLRSCAGGLAGYLRRGEILNSCSSVGVSNIPGIDYSGAGGLIGYREIPADGYIINGYWDTSMTDIYGVTHNNITVGLSIAGITTDQMKLTTFIDLLNQNASILGDGYTSWMSDQYTNLNNGYPIHEREVLLEPIIATNPTDTASLVNGETVQVTISSIIPTSSIWYTTDGTNPEDSLSRIEYTSPFSLSAASTAEVTKTIKAVTTNGNGTYSTIAVKLVKFLAVPTSPGGGTGGGSSGGGSGGGGGATIPIPEGTPPLVVLPMPDISDITGHWAESGIRKAFGLGFINGYIDKTFRPERQITRAEFLTMLVKALGMTTPKAISWDDVNRHWAKEQIQIAAENDIVEGLSNNLFGPDEIITREQMAVMLARAMKLSAGEQKNNFRDGKDISNWAINEIDAATQWKLIQGYEDSTFRPQGPATRAEAVEIIIRALAYQENLDQSVTGAQ